MNYRFYSNCVTWPRAYVGELMDMVDNARDITRRTFLRNVGYENVKPLELATYHELHWKQGMTMASNWSVTYHKSKLCGRTVYYFCYSSIEYVFVPVDFKLRKM
jgi:hypothetical protein